MALGVDYTGQDCSLARSLEIVGERWTLLVLRNCFFGVRRFSDFQAHLGISRAVLTDRLAGLVDDGLLERVPAGAREEYVLTEAGLALWPALFALTQWGEATTSPGRPAPGLRPRPPAAPTSSRAAAARPATRSPARPSWTRAPDRAGPPAPATASPARRWPGGGRCWCPCATSATVRQPGSVTPLAPPTDGPREEVQRRRRRRGYGREPTR